jgi:Cu/Ag efflux protein CusF
MIAKDKEIFTAKCALCHGEKGDGKGPGAVNLPLKPADLTDGKMVAEMAGNFWVGRVSEGGLVEPFKSKGSAIPAWKGELPMNDRWAVIAYAHTFSGHKGPHVATEHPELKPKPKFVTGEGAVIALRPEKQQIVVEHGDIKGFMEAMTMGYKTNPTSLLTDEARTVQYWFSRRFAAVLFPLSGVRPDLPLSVVISFLDALYVPLRKRVAAAQFEDAKLRATGAVLDFAAQVRAAFYGHQANEQTLAGDLTHAVTPQRARLHPHDFTKTQN